MENLLYLYHFGDYSTLERPIGNDNGKTSFQCIIIDNGTIEFTKNRFPLPLATLKEKKIV
jgi:hypothetical protein